ncbi:VOC family protein [Falsigemmobacter faecalis]|uniref:VOC family protein n=1 Tax=Falsigemmobacter faecalis TaxID=2488730 RepID=A0A3P3DAV3_9RHOB|nr:VOC family protein [Falsigemmobacter faecalis]RRH71480.1 VOC family protein [Falsigemmobacter faecalis]
MGFQGTPCWYELGTPDPEAAAKFYSRLLGWQISDSGMTGIDYRLARSGEDTVAGLMPLAERPDSPPQWLIYFAAEDCDRSAAALTQAGGQILQAPADIPGTGRFAVVRDPQGARFGLLQPDMSNMSESDRAKAEAGRGAFSAGASGHAQWNELMSADPEAAFRFYTGLFGWTRGEAMPMGEAGDYQLFRHEGRDIGAMMGLDEAPASVWLPYFGSDLPITKAIEVIRAEGGQVHHGPMEVPGPAFIAVAQDPQGAWFALIGKDK